MHVNTHMCLPVASDYKCLQVIFCNSDTRMNQIMKASREVQVLQTPNSSKKKTGDMHFFLYLPDIGFSIRQGYQHCSRSQLACHNRLHHGEIPAIPPKTLSGNVEK